MYILNLDILLPIAVSRYSLTGKPNHDESKIFCALAIMTHLEQGNTSFVKRLKSHPLLAVICGFESNTITGVGTFYDSLDRFWLAEDPHKLLCESQRRNLKN